MTRAMTLAVLMLAIAVLPLPTNGAWVLDAEPMVESRSSFQIIFEDLNADHLFTGLSELTSFSGVTIFTNYRTSIYNMASIPYITVPCVAPPCSSGTWIFGSEGEGIVVVYATDWSYRLTGPPPTAPPPPPTATRTATSVAPPPPTATVTMPAPPPPTATSTATRTATATPTATQILPAGSIHVGDLDGTSEQDNNMWSARLTITAHTGTHAALSGVKVTGSWSAGGTSSCTTTTSGKCTVTKSNLNSLTSSVTFTVTSLTNTGWTYTPGANHDPDGESDGTMYVFSQPADG